MFEPNRHYSSLRNLFILFASVPLFSQVRYFLDSQFPANLFASLSHLFGHTALVLLILTLAITPLRRWLTVLFRLTRIKWGKRLADWNFLIQLRRPIGLAAFFYLLLHIFIYLYLELAFDWHAFLYEIRHREFLLPGLLAAILTTVLAFTSPNYCRRKLGRWWRSLHRGIYILCPLAAIHYLWFAKATDFLPWVYLILITILLLHRMLVSTVKRLKRNEDTGMEVSRATKNPGL